MECDPPGRCELLVWRIFFWYQDFIFHQQTFVFTVARGRQINIPVFDQEILIVFQTSTALVQILLVNHHYLCLGCGPLPVMGANRLTRIPAKHVEILVTNAGKGSTSKVCHIITAFIDNFIRAFDFLSTTPFQTTF